MTTEEQNSGGAHVAVGRWICRFPGNTSFGMIASKKLDNGNQWFLDLTAIIPSGNSLVNRPNVSLRFTTVKISTPFCQSIEYSM